MCTTKLTYSDSIANATMMKHDTLYAIHHRSNTSLQNDLGLTDMQIGKLHVLQTLEENDPVAVHTRQEMKELAVRSHRAQITTKKLIRRSNHYS